MPDPSIPTELVELVGRQTILIDRLTARCRMLELELAQAVAERDAREPQAPDVEG